MIVQKQIVPASQSLNGRHDEIINTVFAAPKNDPDVLRLIDETGE